MLGLGLCCAAVGDSALAAAAARIIRAVKKWEALGVDCINFILNATEVVPQEEVMASLRLFAQEVMPHFKKADAKAAAE